MKKLTICCSIALILGLMPGVAFALSLNFDFNHDGIYDTEWALEPPPGGDTVQTEVWLDEWDTSPWSSEPLFGVKLFFYYDETRAKVNSVTPHDNHNNGPFDAGFSVVKDLGGGKYQLEVADFNCVSITNKALLFTIELECIAQGDVPVSIKADYPTGAVSPGGPACSTPHTENANDGSATIHQGSSTTSTSPTFTTSIITTTTPNLTTSTTVPTTTTTPITTTSIATTTTTTSPSLCAIEKIYGEYSESTQLLRCFRDDVLSKTSIGQELITLYYEWSPALVKAVKEDEVFRKGIKITIDEIVRLIYSQVE